MSSIQKYILWTLAATVAVFIFWYFSAIVSYILVSAVLAILGKPMVDNLRRARLRGRQIPRWLASAVALITIWAVTLLFFWLFIPLVFSKMNELSTLDLHQMVESFRQPIAMFQEFLERTFSIRQSDFSLADSLTRQVSSFFEIGGINKIFTSTVSTVGHLAIAIFSISFITFFFMKEENLFVNMVVALFPARYEQNVKHALESITNLLIRYFTGLMIESTIMLLLISVALVAWGMTVSDAFFIGLLMGIMNVIPYIGPIIGAALSVFIGILNPIDGLSAMQMASIIGGTIFALKMCDDFIFQPVLYSNSVKAHPLEIFLVLLIAGSIAGVWGMLLAIPTYNVVRVFAKEFFHNYKLVQKLTDKL